MSTTRRVHVGVDPGKAGGIAAVNGDGLLVLAEPMPETDADMWSLVCRLFSVSDGLVTAVLERVSATPQMGVVSAFKFGQGVGAVRMALAAALIPFDEVSPQKWQTALGCRSGGDKNVTKRRAQELFPQAKVTHAVADALLIAEYGRRVASGQLVPDKQREPAGTHPLTRARRTGLF